MKDAIILLTLAMLLTATQIVHAGDPPTPSPTPTATESPTASHTPSPTRSPTPSPAPYNNSDLISQTPTDLVTIYINGQHGGRSTVSATFKNTGTTTWSSDGGYRVVTSYSPWGQPWCLSSFLLSLPPIELPAGVTVAPNEQYTFTGEIVAHSNCSGFIAKYDLSSRLTKNSAAFGDSTFWTVYIYGNTPSPTPTRTPSPSASPTSSPSPSPSQTASPSPSPTSTPAASPTSSPTTLSANCGDLLTVSETIMEGTVTNDHTFTHASDAAYESISAGFFAQQDHRWIIPVSGGIGRLFHMEAFRTSSSETFTASYSLDNSNFTDMFEVTAIGTDPNSYQTFVLPDGIEGNVYIRLQDTPAGFPSVSVRVDHMFIRTSGCPTPTPSPSPTCLVHFPLATPYPALTPPATPSVVVDVPGWGGATLQPAGTIQSAVQAALTGDRISLTGSSYTETVTVTNKMLWIEDTADPPATWTGITLPSAELVAGDGRPALIIGQGGVVILKNLNLFGGNSAAHWPGFLELFGSWGGDAGPAIEVQDGGIVYLVDSQAQGGNGDSGSHHDHLTCSAPTGYEGGNGGAGINIVSGQAYADLQGLLTGGAAGYGWAGMELIGQSCCIPPAANGFPSVPLDPAESTNFKWSGFNFTNSLDSLLLAQSIPSQAGSGLESVFFITLQNTGDVTWRIGANHMLSVISDSCDMFTPAAIALPGGADVPPGGTAIFTSVITGASAPASCDLLFQMTHNGTPFGAIAGATIDVQTANNDALFPGDTIPSSMAPNQGAWIGLTAKNTGNTQWPTDGSYMLTVLDDPCGLIPLPNVVPTDYINPNMQHQFLIHLTAPGTTSPCALQLQMEEVLPDPIRTTSGPGLFGEVFSTTVQIEEPPNVVHDWRVYE